MILNCIRERSYTPNTSRLKARCCGKKTVFPSVNYRSNQQQPHCVPDGSGGFIVVWWDERNIFADIYAQRIDVRRQIVVGRWKMLTYKTGSLSAPEPACSVCLNLFLQITRVLLSIGLTIERTSGIQLKMLSMPQRLDGAGNSLWDIDGVPVCSAPKEQISPQAVSTGLDAAIIVWSDARNSDYDIYIQQIP